MFVRSTVKSTQDIMRQDSGVNGWNVLICEGGHGRTAVWRGTELKILFQKALHHVRPDLALTA